MRYVLSGFLLVLPLLLFDAAVGGRLPRPYRKPAWDAVPRLISVPELILRVPVVLLPLLLPIDLSGPLQWAGLGLYLAGVLAYVGAWTAVIRWPHAAWSTGPVGFLAPAYTPALWLTGVALVGAEPSIAAFAALPWVFLGVSAAFVVVHTVHARHVLRHETHANAD